MAATITGTVTTIIATAIAAIIITTVTIAVTTAVIIMVLAAITQIMTAAVEAGKPAAVKRLMINIWGYNNIITINVTAGIHVYGCPFTVRVSSVSFSVLPDQSQFGKLRRFCRSDLAVLDVDE